MKRYVHWILLCSVFAVLTVSSGLAQTQTSINAAKTVRPEIGKPVQAAIDLLKIKKPKEALAKLREADLVQEKTQYEAYIVDSVRGQAAAQSGDAATASASLDAAALSAAAPAGIRTQLTAAAAAQYYLAKDYAKAAERMARYYKEGGSDASLRTLYIQSLYLANDHVSANKELLTDIHDKEKAGNAPPEEWLQLLANIALKEKDSDSYASALEKLVAYYPKHDYWLAVIDATARRPRFADRLTLDLMRLKFATGTIRTTAEYMEMAQLSLQAGYPTEATQVIEAGYIAGQLGTGSEASRHKRLKDLAARSVADDDKSFGRDDAQFSAAKDGTLILNAGFNYVLHGQNAQGLEMMEQGLKKGGMKHVDDARLHLAYALKLSQEKVRAIQILKLVQGTDGPAALARLWELYLGQRLQ